MTDNSAQRKLIGIETVVELTGLSRSTLRRLYRSGEFPTPLSLTERIKKWPEHEVMDWITALKPAA